MASISDYLKQILSARYGKDVRQSIHDAIQQCYYDGKAGSIDLEARQSIEDLDNNKLDKTGDSANNTVTFTSGDSTSPTGWADIVKVASGETHASLLRKFSLAVKNLRYLYKMLGSTDISSISDGTVTGILSFLKSSLDTTNSNLNNCYNKNIRITTPTNLAQTPSAVAYSLAPICIDADGSSDKRAGIGFHNQGVIGAFLFLDTDAALYLILSSGAKFKINMTQVD